MGEVKTSKAPKKNRIKGLKAEFNKIIWPNKITLAKESTAVVVVSILLGVIISVIDLFVKSGIEFIVK